MERRNMPCGRDIGNLTDQRKQSSNQVNAIHDATFAPEFHAFNSDGTIHQQAPTPRLC